MKLLLTGAAAAQEVLRRQAGVKSADVNFASERGRIEYDPEQVDLPAVLRKLGAAGVEALGLERSTGVVRISPANALASLSLTPPMILSDVLAANDDLSLASSWSSCRLTSSSSTRYGRRGTAGAGT